MIITGTAKIHFKYCAQLINGRKFPVQSSASGIIENYDRKPFISDAIELLKKNSAFLDKNTVVSCEDSNSFMDCKAVGETIGKIFAYDVDC